MIFGSRRREGRFEDAPYHRDDATGEAADLVSQQQEVWRRAAQRVMRAWNEWSAADGRRRSEMYRRYISALDEEELAAASLERAVADGA